MLALFAATIIKKADEAATRERIDNHSQIMPNDTLEDNR